MITSIIKWLVLFLLAVFVIVWLVGGGWRNIKAAVPHYYNPVQFAIEGTHSTGVLSALPGTPSNFPTLTVGSTATSTVDQPPAVTVTIGASASSGAQQDANATTSGMGPIVPVHIIH